MGKVNPTVLIILAVIILAFLYMANQRNRLEQQSRAIEGQTALINAQTAQQTACQNSWVCASSTILSGIGGVAANLNFSGLFGGGNNSNNN